MRRILPLFMFCLFCFSFAEAQTSLAGKVTDPETGEELIAANVVLYKDGVLVEGTTTDFDGNYKINVDPGTYDVEFRYIGYPTNKVTGVKVFASKLNKLDAELGGGDEGINLEEVIVTAYKVPLIEKDNTTSGGIITSEQIRNLPTKNISALAATTAGLAQADEGDDISIRGSRADGTDYYIDGMRVRGSGSLIPQSEIDQLQVITGGIEAQYGDVTGGIISITTKGPSSKYSGGIEYETSEFLDSYGYNLYSANVSGPILKKKTGESILGFRFSGQYITRLDDDPPATDIFRVKEDKLAELEANPIIRIGQTPVIAAELLTQEDVDILDYQPNEESARLDLTGKLDLRVSKAIDLTFTGSYSDAANRFTPGEGSRSDSHWRLLNTQNNPEDHNTRYRGNVRFRHKLSQANPDAEESEGSALFSNIQYTLQGSYEKRLYDVGDWNHGENLFDYGHVGRFDFERVPQYDEVLDSFGFDSGERVHIGYLNQLTAYDAGTSANPGLSNYNNFLGGELPTDNDGNASFSGFPAINGQFQGTVTSAWNYHTNVNQVYNLYRKLDNDLINGNVTVNFDLNPGGSDKGTHSVQLGFMYEQRYNRGYDLAPRGLWTVARQNVNDHLSSVDTNLVVGNTMVDLDEDVDIYAPLVTELNDPAEPFASRLFYLKVRELTGDALNEYVNIDALNPSDMSLDMFSFSELNAAYNQISLDYYGFDFRGNLIPNTTTFDDFFNATETINGLTFKTRPVAPINPIYFAGYIQDKFSFKDIIFRVGVRVDRYDANTKVLRDPYSLYGLTTAGEFLGAQGEPLPGVVESDFKVYTTTTGGNTVKAFRDGDQWYTAEGDPVNNSSLIFDSVINPAYPEGQVNDIKSPDFDPDVSFEDYEPQFNVMPRLAFSFPISDDAGFFAHYDILVQRPSAVGINVDRATALDYYNFLDRQPVANPNLKPQKTIDYEVGFQQKVSNSSSLKIAAFYKELRDMISRRTIVDVADIARYDTYGNLDFGTVKGFSFAYDLRRTNNVQLTANYTIQFADGTGSDADSQQGLTNNGNIRTLFPLNYDERHRVVVNLDYRYGSGARYNGPRIGGKDIFSNAGFNIQVNGVSGRPYTAKETATPFDGNGTIGQINGSRLPWNTTANLRLDKSFKIGGPESKFPLNLNVYFRIQNVFNKGNIINIYPVTGSPADDGFLISVDGVSAINTAAGLGREQAYLDAYNWRLVNPNFFSLPRRMYLGAILDF